MTPVISATLGLIIAKSKPRSSAMAKNVWLTNPRLGNPNEILETPRTVFTPKRDFTISIAFKVSTTPFCSAEAVKVRQSMIMSSLGIPIAVALLTMRSAIAKRSSAFAGMPFSSKVNPTTAVPYFFTKGRILARLASSPFTELTIGLPL